MPTDFRLYHGNDLEMLAALLAEELARPPPAQPLLQPETLLIPQPAMRRWLQKVLAERHGIAANLLFLTPGEFVRAALDGNEDAAALTDLGDAATLRWRLWDCLGDARLMALEVFAPLRPLLAGDHAAASAWALAGEIAQAFEKYQAWRRDWLLDWDRGRDRHDWQAELWRRASHGRRHRAARLQHYLARFHGDGTEAPRNLPTRVFAFACQNVSPDVLRVIASVARSGSLHFFAVSPVQGWWGDLASPRERWRVAPEAVFAPDQENPLLAANGHAGRDFVRLLLGYEAVHPSFDRGLYTPPDEAERSGLLHRLQRDLLARRPPPPAEQRAAFAIGDRSLQVHSCPTRLREVQVLHEQLRDLLEHDAQLQPRDIAVLSPDIERYAPLLRAVFGEGEQALPYSLGEGAWASTPVPQAFLQLLALPTAPFAFSQVLQWLSLPALAARFGLEPVELQRLAPWLQQAGARWGLNAEHRSAQSAPAENAYSWSFALDRLLLGLATGEDSSIDGVAALPLPEGELPQTLDALLQALRALARWQQRLSRPQPAREWPTLLTQMLAELFLARAGSDEAQALAWLQRQIDVLAKEIDNAGVVSLVPAAVLQAWFRGGWQDADARQPALSGGITCARMVPMRLIPFKVICLLGMNADEFPRRDAAGGLNRLAAQLGTPQRRPGDRSLREDDRLLFLQLFGAASDVFYLSYLGRDARNGSRQEPSLVVTELLEIATAYLRPAGERDSDDAQRREQLLVEHPLQPFSPRAFGSRDPRCLSYRQEWRLPQAVTTTPGLPRFANAEAAVAESGELSRDALLAALAAPARTFLQQALQLQLPREEEQADDAEPFGGKDRLRLYQLRRELFGELLATPQIELEPLQRRLLARALIAPGQLGRQQLQALLPPLRRKARQWLQHAPEPAEQRAFELQIAGLRLHGSLGPVHAGQLLHDCAGRAHGKNRLRANLDWLLWSATGESGAMLQWFEGESDPRQLPPLPPAQARERLQAVIALYRRSLREALPYAPKSAFAYAEALAAGDDETRAWQAAATQWLGGDAGATDRALAEGDDPELRLALRGRDPFALADSDAAHEFRILARQLVAALSAPAEPTA